MPRPQVFYQQKDLSQVVVGIDSSVLGIAGNAKWGPAGVLTPLDGLQTYVQLFGKPVDPETTPVFYQLHGWFKLSKSAWFVRSQGDSLFGGVEGAKTVIPAAITAGIADLPLTPSASNVIGIYTKYAGEHEGGTVKIEIFDVDVLTGTFGIQVGVKLDTAGTALDTGDDWFEEHRVSVIRGAKDEQGRAMYIKDVLDRDSQLIAGCAKTGATITDIPAVTTTPVTLAHNEYVESTEGEVSLAYDLFKSLDAVTIDLIVPSMFTSVILDKIAEVAIARGDTFYIVSPEVDETWTLEGISGTAGWVSNLTKHWAGAGYAQYYKIKDEYNDTMVYVPAAGAIAGAYAYNDAVAAQWNAPAGAKRGIQPGVELAVNWTASDRDTLYDRGLNWVSKSPRYGVTIEGQKTLYGGSSALNRVNVARLMLKLRRDLTIYLEDYIYELNNARNRSLIYGGIDNYLRDIKAREGLYDYRVICDETNNTPSLIDQNKLIVDIYVKPPKVAEFIYLKTTITSTGVEFDKIISQAG